MHFQKIFMLLVLVIFTNLRADGSDLKVVRLSAEKEAWLNKDIGTAIELMQIKADSPTATAVTLYNLGFLYFIEGQNSQALKYLQKAKEIDETYPYPYLLAARIYENTGNLLGALSQIRRGLALNADNYDLLLESAIVQKKLGKTEESEKILLELVQEYEDRVKSRIYLAEIYRKQNQFDRAMEILSTEDIVYPESDLLIEKANIHRAAGEKALARDVIIRLYQEYPHADQIKPYLDTLKSYYGVESVEPKPLLRTYNYTIQSGESLDYTASYGFITLGWLKIRMLPATERNGRKVFPINFFVDTNPSFDFLLSLHHIYESYIDAETMNAVQTRLYTPGNADYLVRIYYFEYLKSNFEAYTIYADGRFDLVKKLLPRMAQDGTSMLYFARGLVSNKMNGSTTVVIDEEFKYGHITFLNEREEIDVGDKDINALKIFARAEFEGIAGMNGDAWGWFTPDNQSVPILGKIKILLGSISLKIDEGQLD